MWRCGTTNKSKSSHQARANPGDGDVSVVLKDYNVAATPEIDVPAVPNDVFAAVPEVTPPGPPSIPSGKTT